MFWINYAEVLFAYMTYKSSIYKVCFIRIPYSFLAFVLVIKVLETVDK